MYPAVRSGLGFSTTVQAEDQSVSGVEDEPQAMEQDPALPPPQTMAGNTHDDEQHGTGPHADSSSVGADSANVHSGASMHPAVRSSLVCTPTRSTVSASTDGSGGSGAKGGGTAAAAAGGNDDDSKSSRL